VSRSGSFVHLHCHADGSMLDGLALVKDLVPAAQQQGMPAIAITDHGSMAATYDLAKAAAGTDVKPIFGIEAYVAPQVPRSHRSPVRWGDGTGDDVSGNGAYTHMTLLAENNTGLRNLFAISSEAYLTGFYRKPRCVAPGETITTPRGDVPIEQVTVGDMVLTGKGRWRPVTATMTSTYAGMLYGIHTHPDRTPTWFTAEHPILVQNPGHDAYWVEAQHLSAAVYRGAHVFTPEHPSAVSPPGGEPRLIDVPVLEVLTKPYRGDVHNLEVEEDHTYVCTMVTHNCDVDLLSEHAEGVLATTGCPSGEVQTLLRLGKYEEAKKSAGTFRDIFGDQNFFVEVMDHGLDIERRVQRDLIRLGKELGLPFVATNDLHYVHQSDATAHEALLCLQSGSKLDDPNRFKFDSQDFYLKTAEEMRAIWDGELPDACDNTLLIAERCTATFEEGKDLMPRFPVPEGWTEETWFAKEVRDGVKARYPDGVPDDRKTQTDYEIDVIIKMGFAGYFLVVADFVQWAKDNGIRVGPGRGSAAGSIVAYGLGITELDPISNGLIFERFLNPERLSPPDIDIDFDEKRRGEVIAYVRERYGDDRVANIGTFMQIKAKAAIKDAARVLNHPYSLGDRLTKAYPPPIVGRDLSLEGAYDPSHERYGEAAEFRELVSKEPGADKVVELGKGLEGAKRGHGMHAAGVIMSSEPLIDHVPVMKRDPEAPVMTQFEYPTCENIGLIKMDFLGLSNLTTLDNAITLIRDNHGVEIDLQDLWANMTDAPTFDLLARGDTLGVFQLDSPPIRSLLRLMQPDTFNDISAVLALYRPGPMGAGAHLDYADRKNGRKPVTPIHPEFADTLHEVLADTYGVIVFQEQVMEIAQKVAGYSLGQADLLRRAMGKKKKEILDKEFEPFNQAAQTQGYSPTAIKTLWDVLVPFSDYAFNRAHSAAYGYISYATAYLKANYPAEYMAALLTTNESDRDKTALYLGECRQMGLRVLPPDINTSTHHYTVDGGAIRVGLTSLKNIGGKATEALIEERTTSGLYANFEDFLLRCPKDMLRKRNIEALIKAGAFDSFGVPRAALLECHEDAVDAVAAYRKNTTTQDTALFDISDLGGFSFSIPDIREWDQRTLLRHERDIVGLYVSSHPLEGLEHALRGVAPATITEIQHSTAADGTTTQIAGLVTAIQTKTTRKGDPYAVITLEDLTGTMSVMLFPRIWESVRHRLLLDDVAHVTGRLERKDDGTVSIIPQDVSPLDVGFLADPDSRPLDICVPEQHVTTQFMSRLKSVLREHPGTTPVQLRIQKDTQTVVMRAGEEWNSTRSPALISEIKAVAGTDSLPHETGTVRAMR